MENILALIVIIITIVSAVNKARRKRKPEQSAKAAAPGDLAAKLKVFFNEVQEKFDAQSRKSTPGASPWGQLMPDESTPGQPEHYDMSLEDLVLEEETAPAEADKKPPARAARKSTKQKKPPVSEKSSKERVEKKPEPPKEMPPPAYATLRRAIVWSEILGPPVALRDDPRQR